MRAVALIWYVIVVCLIDIASASQANALRLRVWVVEQNILINKCAKGEYPSKYGGCVLNAYNAGKANPTSCTDLEVSFTGVGFASKRLVLSRGYAELDVPGSMLLAAREPMVHISVPGANILYLPGRPDGPPPQGRIDICKGMMCSTPEELKFYADPVNKQTWLGFTIVVEAGSCPGSVPPTRSETAPRKAPAKGPTPLHKS